MTAPAASTENAAEMMKLTKKQIEVTMFAYGADNINSLEKERRMKAQFIAHKGVE